MVDFVNLLRKYEINKKLKEEIYSCQGIEGKIIEKELEFSVAGKEIQNLRLESGIGLHTLRIGLGKFNSTSENGLVIHMAKESLRAFQLTPPRIEDSSKKGIILNFRENIHVEPYDGVDAGAYDKLKLDLNVFEKGISCQTIDSIGKIMGELELSDIVRAFPSWYYEDWVQIHFRNKELLLRIDPHCLYGIGIGRVNKSTINYFSKEDTIFYWRCWMNRNIERDYERAGSDCPYDMWPGAKVKVKKEDKEE